MTTATGTSQQPELWRRRTPATVGRRGLLRRAWRRAGPNGAGRAFLLLSLAAALLAVTHAQAADLFSVVPKTLYSAKIPAIDKVTGKGWGDELTSAEGVLAYARLLAEAAPERVKLVEYARSLEGRPLVYLVISSSANISRLEELRTQVVELGDPRKISSERADALIKSVPAVVWILCSVHGDETSGGDAGLALAYHLTAGSGPEVDAILDNTLVIIDPAQNPDGRARFVASTRQAQGVRPDPEPTSAEHQQPWPGGRVSHDLFDLNRDWFALTHPETVGRVRALLEYPPMVAADLHEMGADQGYFFAPPAKPYHPLLAKEQHGLLELLGRSNAAAFDSHGVRYWTREVFDSFYPGYGESWPLFSGAIGMTYEEASSRGLVVRLRDDTLLTYADAVQHHLLAAYSTCATTAANRERFVRGWYGFRQATIKDGQTGSTRAFVLEGGRSPRGAAELAELLARQGIETFRVTNGVEPVSAGAFLVPLDQPLGRLASVLLEKTRSMGEEFEQEQERREKKRLPDEIYDLTAWTLPLLWNVPAKPLAVVPRGLGLEAVRDGQLGGGRVEGSGKVAYLMPWDGPWSARALAQLLQAGVKTSAASKPLALLGRRFERGTIVIRRAGNLGELDERIGAIARSTGAGFVGVDTSYAEEGIDLGSNNVIPLIAPRVVLLWDTPTSSQSAGQLRWVLERYFGYPVSVVRTSSLGATELKKFDVVIMPDSWSGYSSFLSEAGFRRLAAWVGEGGTLVAIGSAAAFLCDEKVGLLSSKLEKRGGKEAAKPDKSGAKDEAKDTPAAPSAPVDYETAILPAEEDPPSVPGAILRVDLNAESCLAAGFPDGVVNVLVNSRRVFAPVKLDRGTNIGIYGEAGSMVQAGFLFAASRKQLPRKAYLMLERHRRGQVIGFAEDPAARGMARASMLLLANAVFLAPAL
jgi:hypothetical protein